MAEQLECVLLQKIYPLLSLNKFPSQIWADDVQEKVKEIAICMLVIVFCQHAGEN